MERRTQLIGAGLATLWLLSAIVVDVAAPGASVSLSPLFALGPLIAGAVLPAGPTTVFALAAGGAAVASGWWNHTWGSTQQLVCVLDVLLISGAAVVVAVIRVHREQGLARVSAIAEVAQRAILPTLPTRARQVTVASRYVSAVQGAFVGGDLYDCYLSDTYTRFLVGDVRGKGLAAVEQAARVIRAFRQSAATQLTLPAVAKEMSAYLAPFFDDEEFVTALLLEVSQPTELTVVSCGHPQPVLVHGSDSAAFLDPPAGLPLGLGDSYSSLTVPWTPGERLLMYTDGLSEARDAHGEFLPLLALAPQLTSGSLDEVLDQLLGAMYRHLPDGQLTDDLAVVLLEHTAADYEPG